MTDRLLDALALVRAEVEAARTSLAATVEAAVRDALDKTIAACDLAVDPVRQHGDTGSDVIVSWFLETVRNHLAVARAAIPETAIAASGHLTTAAGHVERAFEMAKEEPTAISAPIRPVGATIAVTGLKKPAVHMRGGAGATNVVVVIGSAATDTSGDACLVLLYPPGPDMGKRFTLTRKEIVLGRGGDCDIQIDRDSVSRRHARVYRNGDSWSVQDLQSTNGSYVNDLQVENSVLRDADFLKIGAAIFKFLSGSSIEASYHEEIYRMTIVDALTGAHNKRYFLEFLDREIARCADNRRPLSLLLLDIDHFKQINDKHGHLTGDYLLHEMSRRLLGRVRRQDLLARYGGEEFAVVLPDVDAVDARTIAEQLRGAVADEPFEYEGDQFPATVSIGVATIDGIDLDVSAFIKVADDNLFRAKREGRNRVVSGAKQWNRWKADPGFRESVTGKTAVVALTLLGRDQILAAPGGAARVDDLEGLLYSRLREHKDAPRFGTLEDAGKLLVALDGRNAVTRLRMVCLEALRACVDASPDAHFATGPVMLASDQWIESAISRLDDELGRLENGHYLPQPIAVALGALGPLGMLTPARAKFVLELGETLLQWLALCATAELLHHGDSPKLVETIRRNLSGSVTMGRWNEIFVMAVNQLLDTTSVHAGTWRASLGDKGIRSDVFGRLSSLVELRNAFAHGATASDEHVARRIVDDAAPRLAALIRGELRAVLALVPAEVELVGFEGELQSYRMTRLVGDGIATTASMFSRRRMNPGLWWIHPMADRAIPLEPLFVRDTCPKCGARELFLLTRLDRLEFRNPGTNHVLRLDGDGASQTREQLGELLGPT